MRTGFPPTKFRKSLFARSILSQESELFDSSEINARPCLKNRRHYSSNHIFIERTNIEPIKPAVLEKIATLLSMQNHEQKQNKIQPQQSKKIRLYNKYQKLVYLFLENPMGSSLSKLTHFLIVFGIFWSLCTAIFINPNKHIDPSRPLRYGDAIVLVIFSLEIIMRAFSATAFNEKLTKILLKPLVVIDSLAIVPLFISAFMSSNGIMSIVSSPSLINLLKALSVLKLMRYVKNRHVLMKGLHQSLVSFVFLMFIILLANLVFATLAYYAEKGNSRSRFQQGIPAALWWSIVTMTTVGYGDIVPITPLGKMIGGVLGVFGMMVLTLPVVILGYHFEEVCNEVEDEEKINRVKARILRGKDDLKQQDQQEAYFISRRITEIEKINKQITEQLESSGDLYKYVSRDLKSLYTSVYAEDEIEMSSVQEGDFGSKANAIRRFTAAKQRISVINLFKRGFGTRFKKLSSKIRQTDKKDDLFPKSEDLKPIHLSMDLMDISPNNNSLDYNSRRAQSLDQLNISEENITFDQIEVISKMNLLESKQSPLYLDKSPKTGQYATFTPLLRALNEDKKQEIDHIEQENLLRKNSTKFNIQKMSNNKEARLKYQVSFSPLVSRLGENSQDDNYEPLIDDPACLNKKIPNHKGSFHKASKDKFDYTFGTFIQISETNKDESSPSFIGKSRLSGLNLTENRQSRNKECNLSIIQRTPPPQYQYDSVAICVKPK